MIVMMSKLSVKAIVLISLASGLLFISVTAAVLAVYYTGPVSDDAVCRDVIIKEGMNLRQISGVLENEGVIKNSTAFILFNRITGSARGIKAGEYLLSPSMTPGRIIEVLTKGEVVTHPVTIPEGFSIEQIADVLAEEKLIDRAEFLNFAGSAGVENRYGIDGHGLEGYLYPDTYHFARNLNASSIADAMIKRFKDVIKPYGQSIAGSGMTLHEVVTLASIVEKETGRADERPLIASVFLNRLKKNMRLESDPTVIYGIKNFSGNIKKTDLSTRTPYNTYVVKGLPPGPIASPGLDSIKAVLYPADTDYLFFVSKNDGSHHFSKSLKEHNRAVYIYQKKRKK